MSGIEINSLLDVSKLENKTFNEFTLFESETLVITLKTFLMV